MNVAAGRANEFGAQLAWTNICPSSAHMYILTMTFLMGFFTFTDLYLVPEKAGMTGDFSRILYNLDNFTMSFVIA